jgi:hypothetical protein
LLIGDIHTELDLLTTALAHADSVDRVLSVGDIVDGPHDPLACIALLRRHEVDVVRGNHERWVLEGHPFEPFDYPNDALAWLRTLPVVREYDTPSGRFLLGHGIGSDDMVRLEPDTDGYALECLDPVEARTRSRISLGRRRAHARADGAYDRGRHVPQSRHVGVDPEPGLHARRFRDRRDQTLAVTERAPRRDIPGRYPAELKYRSNAIASTATIGAITTISATFDGGRSVTDRGARKQRRRSHNSV